MVHFVGKFKDPFPTFKVEKAQMEKTKTDTYFKGDSRIGLGLS